MKMILGALLVLLLLLQYEFWFSDGGMKTVWQMQKNIEKQNKINAPRIIFISKGGRFSSRFHLLSNKHYRFKTSVPGYNTSRPNSLSMCNKRLYFAIRSE